MGYMQIKPAEYSRILVTEGDLESICRYCGMTVLIHCYLDSRSYQNIVISSHIFSQYSSNQKP